MTSANNDMHPHSEPPVHPADPPLECDVVMAGGVTSGIIYPGAVAMIARRYRFRSIGGTSVGAIAAAVTAAAEYGRWTGCKLDAFDVVRAIPLSLAQQSRAGHSRLYHLFAPEASTGALFDLVAPIFQGGGTSRFMAAFAKTLKTWRIGAAPIIAAVGSFFLIAHLVAAGDIFLGLVALFAAFALVSAAWGGALILALRGTMLPAWRDNGYGLCTGMATPSAVPEYRRPKLADFESLTVWMHGAIQDAAGRAADGNPLTFGDLWTAGTGAPEGATDIASLPRSIELSMIASDISRNRTVQLPFIESPSAIYVDLATLAAYFPASVVAWFKDHQGESEDRMALRDGIIRLPKPQDLPIVFAARLSLSFPFLLAAVPLLTPDFAAPLDAQRKIPLRKLWLSDGGLTSNFPIHFFDSPVPARPTFCLNLIDYGAASPVDKGEPGDTEGAAPTAGAKAIHEPDAASRTAAARPESISDADPQPGDNVWEYVDMVKGNRWLPVPFCPFDKNPAGAGVGAFLNTLLNTARFWSDNQMLVAPGVRDRVVNIALKEDEGGLNLDMAPNIIADLDLRGRAAGLLVSARFDVAGAIDPETGATTPRAFFNHRWARYRNFMSGIEDILRRFVLSRVSSDAAAQARDEPTVEDMINGRSPEPLSYAIATNAPSFYDHFTRELERVSRAMSAETQADQTRAFDRPLSAKGRSLIGSAPRPKMRLSLRPMADNDPRAMTADFPPADATAKPDEGSAAPA